MQVNWGWLVWWAQQAAQDLGDRPAGALRPAVFRFQQFWAAAPCSPIAHIPSSLAPPAQFGGYIFRLSESQGAYLLAFGLAVDAVRFCHSAQALLMYSQWPADCAEYCGKTGGWAEAAIRQWRRRGACLLSGGVLRMWRQRQHGTDPRVRTHPNCRAGSRWQACVQGAARGDGGAPVVRVHHHQVGGAGG